MKYITCLDLKFKIDQQELLQIIDTRDAVQFKLGHLEGAINIPQIDLPECIHLINKDIPVVIYCLYGVKSQAPYLYLTEKMKFKNIFILEGGIYQWSVDVNPEIAF